MDSLIFSLFTCVWSLVRNKEGGALRGGTDGWQMQRCGAKKWFYFIRSPKKWHPSLHHSNPPCLSRKGNDSLFYFFHPARWRRGIWGSLNPWANSHKSHSLTQLISQFKIRQGRHIFTICSSKEKLKANWHSLIHSRLVPQSSRTEALWHPLPSLYLLSIFLISVSRSCKKNKHK